MITQQFLSIKFKFDINRDFFISNVSRISQKYKRSQVIILLILSYKFKCYTHVNEV